MGVFEIFTNSAAKKAAAANKAEYEKYEQQGLGALNTAFNPSLEALNEGNEAWSSVANLGGKYGAATDLYQDALGVGGAEGNARARGAYQAGPGFDVNVTEAADRAAREAVSKGISLGGNAADAITRTTSNLYNNEWQKWLGHLQGFVNPELQATTSAAGGKAAGKGAVAGVAGPESANNAASTGAFVPMLALGLPTGPVTAVLMAALLIHGVPPGPTLVNDHPQVFWGFIASMYVGNLMLLALNLPLVGLFVNVLRIPYTYLYPLIIMFCIIGVYEVNHSIVDVWIMLIMGVVGYGLRKLGLDPAPLVLGLVIAPIFEMSLRQSLIMSNGNWTIFFERPIAAVLMAVCAVLLALAAWSLVRSRADWRNKLAEVEEGK